MKAAFAGDFSRQFVRPVRQHLSVACEIVEADETAILPELGDTDVLVSISVTAAMAEAAPGLKLVQVPGAGLDRIDRAALKPETQLANAYGHEAGIAEYVLGSMIALSRSFAHLDRELRRGNWDSQWAVGRPPPPLMPELSGKTLAILGYGHIGKAVARRAAAFGMRILAIRRSATGTPPHPLDRLATLEVIDDILSEADFVVVTLPLSNETRGLLDADRLSHMKDTAILVNVARGEIADEQALYGALANKHIAGAALDVWYHYPTTSSPTMPSNLPFHKLDNVLMTPHASGWTEGMLTARAKVITANIERTSRGALPLNAIDPTS